MYGLKYDPKYDPLEHLDWLGVQVIRRSLVSQAALWVPERRLVICDSSLSDAEARPALAHECSHAEHDDPAGHHPRFEARANLESARRLVYHPEWVSLTAAYDDFDRICVEIGINRGQFIAYRDYDARKRASQLNLQRLGSTVYMSPRMGAKQYSARARVAQ